MTNPKYLSGPALLDPDNPLKVPLLILENQRLKEQIAGGPPCTGGWPLHPDGTPMTYTDVHNLEVEMAQAMAGLPHGELGC